MNKMKKTNTKHLTALHSYLIQSSGKPTKLGTPFILPLPMLQEKH